jgi:manganese/zinc/iron transport system permease protein
MVLCFITGPPLIGRLLTHNLKTLLLLAMGVGTVTSISGVAIARHVLTVNGIALSTAGIVVCTIASFYILAIIFAPDRGLLSLWLHRRERSAGSS